MVDGAGGFFTAFKAAMSVGRKGGQDDEGGDPGQRMTPEDMARVSSEAQAGRHAPAGVPTRKYETPFGTTYMDHYGNPVPDDGTFEELNGEDAAPGRSGGAEDAGQEGRSWSSPPAGGLSSWGK